MLFPGNLNYLRDNKLLFYGNLLFFQNRLTYRRLQFDFLIILIFFLYHSHSDFVPRFIHLAIPFLLLYDYFQFRQSLLMFVLKRIQQVFLDTHRYFFVFTVHVIHVHVFELQVRLLVQQTRVRPRRFLDGRLYEVLHLVQSLRKHRQSVGNQGGIFQVRTECQLHLLSLFSKDYKKSLICHLS